MPFQKSGSWCSAFRQNTNSTGAPMCSYVRKPGRHDGDVGLTGELCVEVAHHRRRDVDRDHGGSGRRGRSGEHARAGAEVDDRGAGSEAVRDEDRDVVAGIDLRLGVVAGDVVGIEVLETGVADLVRCPAHVTSRPGGESSHARGVEAAVDVDDLAGRRREPVADAARRRPWRPASESVTSQPSGARSSQTSSNFLKPGMLLAAIVLHRPGGDEVGADALRAELLGEVAADALAAPTWRRPSSCTPARRRCCRSRARRTIRRWSSAAANASASAFNE